MNASTCPVKEDRLVLTKFSVLATVICIGVVLLLLGIGKDTSAAPRDPHAN